MYCNFNLPSCNFMYKIILFTNLQILFTFSPGTFLGQRNMIPRGKNSPFSRIPSNDVNPGV